jgi:hypothetical protein
VKFIWRFRRTISTLPATIKRRLRAGQANTNPDFDVHVSSAGMGRSGFRAHYEGDDIMENTPHSAGGKALIKSSKVTPKQDRTEADQNRTGPVHNSRLEANQQSITNEDLGTLTIEFHNAFKKSVEGIIEAGNVLIRAKVQLKHGQWEDWVIGSLRFGERAESGQANLRKAQQLMALAENSVIFDPSNFGNFPPSIGKLTVLSKIPEQELLEHIESGKVYPTMTRKETVELKPLTPKPKPKDPPLTTTLPYPIKVLLQFCVDQGKPDIVIAYIRELKREPGRPPKEDFDRAVQFAAQIYQGGR